MFGNTSFNNTSFNNTNSPFGPVFGAQPALVSGFGSNNQPPSQPTGVIGTTIRFVPIQGTDTVQKAGSAPISVTTKHQNICAMKEYESKSVDELRLEDYMANRKHGQPSSYQPPMGGFTSLPSTAPSTSGGISLFGQNQQNNQTTLFGTTSNNSPFSKPTNLFGTPTSNTSGSIFNTSSNTTTGGLFSSNQNTSTNQTNTGLFGSTTNSLFNNTPSNSTNAFSSTNNLFSSQPKPTFGIGTTNQPSTYQPTMGGFSNIPAATPSTSGAISLFGQNQQSNQPTLFGTATNNSPFSKPTNLFSTPTSKTNASIFNTSSNTTTGGLFSSNQNTSTSQTTTGLFGNTTNSLFNNTPNNNTNAFSSTNNLFSSQPKPAFGIGATNQPTTGIATNQPSSFQPTIGGFTSLPAAAPSTSGSISLFGQNQQNNQPSLFGSATNNSPFSKPANLFGTPTSNTSGSIFNTSTNTTAGGLFSSNQNTSANQTTTGLFGNTNNSLFNNTPNNSTNAFSSPNNLFNSQPKQQSPNTDLISNRLKTLPYGESSLFLNDSSSSNNLPSFTTDLKTVNKYKMKARTDIKLNKEAEKTNAAMVLFDTEDDMNDDLKCAIEIFPPKRNIKKLDLTLNSDFLDERSGFISTRPDYRLDPCLEEIERCYDPKNDTCIVNSLLIERPEYGSIYFDSPLDVNGLNLDEIVFIRRKEVVVYPDDENKPPYGHGLNRPAIVTLHQVWPIDKSTNEVIKDVERLNLMKYAEKIKSITAEKNARFIDYRPQSGSWVFAVKHFSKYGITDDDDVDLDTLPLPSSPQPTLPLNQNNHDSTISSQDHIENSILSDKSLAISALFDEIEEPAVSPAIANPTPKPSQFSVHKSKRLALHLREPTTTPTRTPLADTTLTIPTLVSSIPKQPKTRDLKIVPDLYSARNRLARDIMSICVAGSPKVRFFNGSRKYCLVQGDSIMINELKLVPTRCDGALDDTVAERFEGFFNNNSIVTPLNMNPTLAPYIETYDFIPDASSHGLLHALYGNLTTKTPYAKQDERLNRVVDWLASTNSELPVPENLYQQIIYHMSCDRYDLASSLALDNDHPRLALLVATLNLNKDFLFEQLSSWRLSTADQYIDPELLRIYVLLAGLTEWKLSDDSTIYCLKGLKWTQQLCLLALHVTSFSTEPEKYGFHLLPLYIKRLDTDADDVDYQILARHNPYQILSAAETLVEEWFLLESLKSFHVINSETECINSDVIHCNLASQLGSIDLRWACFVALHIINNEVRNQVLIKCLEQNYNQLKDVKQDSSSVESWLIEKLKVPVEFIVSCKSVARVS